MEAETTMAVARSDAEVVGENMEEARITMEMGSNKVAMVEVGRKKVAMEEADNKAIRGVMVEEVTCHRAATTVEAEAMEAAMTMIYLAQLITLNNTQEIQATLESSLAS